MKRRTLGLRRGELHPKAVLTDHEVELVRQLHEQGVGYKTLVKKFEVSKRSIRDICSYKTRTRCG